ncbi:hypothetical protein KM043_000643 [Ampulex compressa]|nr:hypothetical protein KM043_000643 [Ampulex compressa]
MHRWDDDARATGVVCSARLDTFDGWASYGEDTIIFSYNEPKTPGEQPRYNLDRAGDRSRVSSSRFSANSEARDSGRVGRYFSSNFSAVPTEAIGHEANGSGRREFLALEYHSRHVSVIDVELRPDDNALVRARPSVRIVEVCADNTASDRTRVAVVIGNDGPKPSAYRVRIKNCPAQVPASWSNASSPAIAISSRRDERVTLDLWGELRLNQFHCTVDLLNHRGEAIARRRIKVRRVDRCVCIWRCACRCIGGFHGGSPKRYRDASFYGPLSLSTDEASLSATPATILLSLLGSSILLLLLMGSLKWAIGLYIPTVSRWGLDTLMRTSKMCEYFERDLKCRCIVTDQFGVPVHPDTGRRTVRLCSRKAEFFLNVVFFLAYPLAICCYRLKETFRPAPSACPDESEIGLMTRREARPKMIRLCTYGDIRNSRMEAEDTEYVINELKKSRDSLRNYDEYEDTVCLCDR